MAILAGAPATAVGEIRLQQETLLFDDVCAEPERSSFLAPTHHWKDRAFFQSSRTDRPSPPLAVGLVYVGWTGIGVSLDAVQLDTQWADKVFAFAIEAVPSDHSQSPLRGSFTHRYIQYADHPVLSRYQLTHDGQFAINVLGQHGASREPISGHEPPPGSRIDKERINSAQTYAINLIIKDVSENSSGDSVRLEGPILKDFAEYIETAKPEFAVLTFWQTMNPFQQGGLWDTIRAATRYDHCRKLHDKYQQLFQEKLTGG